jgi:hypothetical protein
MDKIQQLQNTLDKCLEQNKRYKKVVLIVNNDNAIIEWSEPYSENWWYFESKQFPLNEIDNIINSYKSKLKQ